MGIGGVVEVVPAATGAEGEVEGGGRGGELQPGGAGVAVEAHGVGRGHGVGSLSSGRVAPWLHVPKIIGREGALLCSDRVSDCCAGSSPLFLFCMAFHAWVTWRLRT